MELKDFAICLVSMIRRNEIRLLPCFSSVYALCPLCGTEIDDAYVYTRVCISLLYFNYMNVCKNI